MYQKNVIAADAPNISTLKAVDQCGGSPQPPGAHFRLKQTAFQSIYQLNLCCFSI